MPDRHVQQTAQIIARYLDPDRDGTVDYPDVLQAWNAAGAWVPMPWTERKWRRQEDKLQDAFGYGMAAPKWWMDGPISQEGPNQPQRQMLFEEITHLFTHLGLGSAFPAQFSVEDYTSSILGRETQKANCTIWQHPENDCPDRRADTNGDCSAADCNATEFLHAVLADLNGVTPANTAEDGYGLNVSGEELRANQSDDFF